MSTICDRDDAPKICYDTDDVKGCVVIGSKDAEETLQALLDEHGTAQASMFAQMVARLKMLSSQGGLRSPDVMNTEGHGFFAVKTRNGLRAYGWFTQCAGKKCFIISHFIYKKKNKLASEDKDRMLNVKRQWEIDRWAAC